MSTKRSFIYLSIIGLLLIGAIFEHFEGQAFIGAIVDLPGVSNFFYPSTVPYLAATSTIPAEIATTSPSTNATSSISSFPSTSQSNVITATEIIALTNIERSTVADLPPLKENSQLMAAANVKLNDLFARQYFAHISPTGVGPADLAVQAGYQYVVEGENLAEGDFLNAQNLLDAWMASPGHRANILNIRYVDIGVAVRQGMYQGQKVWMAVQEFGKPLSSCPTVDSQLRQVIVDNQAKATDLSQQLNAIKQALFVTATGSLNENLTYNQIANHYNNDVDIYNSLVTRLKAQIVAYNQEVKMFNLCIND